jgi:hypothetical protein
LGKRTGEEAKKGNVPMEDQIAELKSFCSEVFVGIEGGITYYLLMGFQLKDGCAPSKTDLLLCPTARDGYPSRLFFGERITSSKQQNWHASTFRILERNWFVYSWRLDKPHPRLASMLSAHLGAL